MENEAGWSEEAIEELSRLYNAGPVVTIPRLGDDWNRNYAIMKALVDWFAKVNEGSKGAVTGLGKRL